MSKHDRGIQKDLNIIEETYQSFGNVGGVYMYCFADDSFVSCEIAYIGPENIMPNQLEL